MPQTTLSDYKNNLFSNHFLEERIQELDEWQETDLEEKFDDLRVFYREKEGLLSEKLNEDQTQDNFIDPILRKLGHDWVTEASKRVGSRTEGKNLNPDYAFMNSSDKLSVHQDDEEPLEINYAVGDAKAWNKKLDKSSQDHTNPAFQIYNYVDRLRADWGVLTNGKKWRLYSYENCAADIYFEVDLENLLAGEKTEEKLQAFKYFYLFFRAESFEEGFLDRVYEKSVEYNEGLEDDLEDKVYNALEVAVEGFFETNDIEKTEENIDLVHHSSLIFLYRVLFILNAESRDLLPTDDEAYRQAFGLTELKRMIIDEEEEDPLFQETTVAWDNRVSRLFEGIDEGYDLHETEIPAYNGGLFDKKESEENQFLAENKLYGTYLKEILELLATRYDEEKDQRVIVDYKDLNIRHLGSVYEGLLEHQFEAADQRKVLKNGEWQEFSEDDDWEDYEEEKRVEEDELYLTNESGERKATGSYYTPEYIVEYIVENTIGPKVEEKIEEAEENGDNILPKVLELNVCDPAMGSGHFLTEATEFIAEHIVEHADLEEQDIDENEDELNWAKRQVVQNCIYGVDVNELAVELGKLSLWIETMAEGKPLNFLDHHLKHGNSLIGSDFDEIFSHPTEDQKRLDSERYQFGDPQEIKESFQEQYLKIEEMPENTVEQIHEKEQAYKQFIQENVLYQQFNQLANIHTRQYFEKEANSSDYESFLINIGNPGNPFENTEWYKNAQQDAENRNYFHWQLEFPKVFFGQIQGFDAVIGNPPWVSFGLRDAGELPDNVENYYRESYPNSAQYKLSTYAIFMDRALQMCAEEGFNSFIVPDSYLLGQYFEKVRKRILSDTSIKEINLILEDFWEDATTGRNTVYSFKKGRELPQQMNIQVARTLEEFRNNNQRGTSYQQSFFESRPLNRFHLFFEDAQKSFIERVEDESNKVMNDDLDINTGMRSRTSQDELKAKEKKGEKWKKGITSSGQVLPYSISYEGDYLHVEEEKLFYGGWDPDIVEQEEKIMIRQTGDRIIAGYDDRQFYHLNNTHSAVTREEVNAPVMFYVSYLNSRLLFSYYILTTLEYGRTMAQTDIETLEKLPLKVPQRITDLEDYERDKVRNRNISELEISESKIPSILSTLGFENKRLTEEVDQINLNIRDYLGNYSDGKTLGDLYSPVEGLSDKVVSDTSANRDSLRIGSVEFEERNDELVLKVSARYKPDDSENIDEDELDRWGYFETEKVSAMKFNVGDKMGPLIEEFVSLAVDEAGGFAGFRESATKTNSVIDRLEKLTLPKLEDVEQDLEKFIDNREEAEALEEEIQETDELIDAIVFDLYDLTEEEVETVLDSLDTEEDERERILEKFVGL